MEVRWLPFAQEQLKVVVQYVVDNFGEMTARNSLQGILDKVDVLKICPGLGVLDKKFSTPMVKVRHLNVGPNVVYYLLDQDEVVVIAVMHFKQSPVTVNRTIRYVLGQYNNM